MTQSIERAARVLELLAEERRSQAEVARDLGVHRSTALRILETLVEAGLARRDAAGRYGIGHRLTALAERAVGQFPLVELAHPRLVALGARTGHTVHLAELVRDQILYADKVDAPTGVRLYSRVGYPVPLHTAAAAKAILARLPVERREGLLAGWSFERHTPHSLDRAGLDAELARVARRGYAVDDREFEDLVNCIAAPVLGPRGDVVASVSITAIRTRAELGALADLVPDLLATARAISTDLGGRPT